MLEIATKVDWSEVESLTSHLLSRLIGFDTTGPDTSTASSVSALHQFLLEDGIQSEVFGPDEERCNLLARLDGSGQYEPLLILAPLDLYPLDGDTRQVYNPFSGYDDGQRIHGLGSRTVKPIAVAYAMALRLIRRFGIRLKRSIRFAAVRDSFGKGTSGLEYLVEENLPLIEAEKCLAWGFPGHAKLNETDIVFIHNEERSQLILDLKVDGMPGISTGGDASRAILEGLNALRTEFDSIFEPDGEMRRVLGELISQCGYSGGIEEAIEEITHAGQPGSETDKGGLPLEFAACMRSIGRTEIQISHIRCGVSGCSIPGSAAAQVRIYPGPGTDLNDCGVRAVAALERLGAFAPEIAKATRLRGSISDPDEEIERVLEGSLAQLSENVTLVNTPCFFHQKLHLLRDIGIGVYGFNPLGSLTDDEQNSNPRTDAGESISKKALTKLTGILFEALVRHCG